MKRKVTVLFAIVLAATMNACTRAPSSGNSLVSPHMNVRFGCDKSSAPEVAKAAVRAMEHRRLQTLDKASLKRVHFPTRDYGVDVLGLERQGRYIVLVMGDVPPTNSYSVLLYTEPPTRPSPEAEATVGSLVRTITRGLGCSVVSVKKHENGRKSLRTYKELLKTYEGWFEQG